MLNFFLFSDSGLNLFSVFISHVIKIVTIQWITSRILVTIDDWCINNLAKNQVSTIFQSRVICRSVSPKLIELCKETPCLCLPEGHKHVKHGGREVKETSVTEFCYWNEKLLLLRSDTSKYILLLVRALFSYCSWDPTHRNIFFF